MTCNSTNGLFIVSPWLDLLSSQNNLFQGSFLLTTQSKIWLILLPTFPAYWLILLYILLGCTRKFIVQFFKLTWCKISDASFTCISFDQSTKKSFYFLSMWIDPILFFTFTLLLPPFLSSVHDVWTNVVSPHVIPCCRYCSHNTIHWLKNFSGSLMPIVQTKLLGFKDSNIYFQPIYSTSLSFCTWTAECYWRDTWIGTTTNALTPSNLVSFPRRLSTFSFLCSTLQWLF